MIKIGVSSCLLGHKVRFDSGHKNNSYINGVLSNYFDFMPFCPEVEIGLGIPRETIRLVDVDGSILCKGSKNESLDVTDALHDIAHEQRHWQESLCGYIFKKDSPSCGMERVKVYTNAMPERRGVGLYAETVMQNFPNLPIEEEGRLGDAKLRENFIQRVYVYARWKEMEAQGITLARLQNFHAQHKYILMSHNQNEARKIGASLADFDGGDINLLAQTYVSDLMRLLKHIATKKNHCNTLQHLQGYLKKHLDSGDKAELAASITDYRNGLVPLIVPITLLRHHFRKHPNDYITGSHYMAPHPGELMLLNTI